MRKPHTADREATTGQSPHGVAERVSEAALERLKAEFCDIGIVFALRRFDELRTDESPEINCVCHFRFSSLNVPPRP